MAKRKKHRVKFTEKKQPVKGMISAGIGIVAILLAIYVAYRTTRSGGNSGMIIGLAGFFLTGMSLVGIILSAVCLKQKEIYYTWPIVGMVTNGILFVGLVFLYFLGLSI